MLRCYVVITFTLNLVIYYNINSDNKIINPIVTCETSHTRVKRQEDDSGDDLTPEQLCDGRPADEYFRLSTEDCREVVRSVFYNYNK